MFCAACLACVNAPEHQGNLLGLLAASMETKTSQFAIFSGFYLT